MNLAKIFVFGLGILCALQLNADTSREVASGEVAATLDAFHRAAAEADFDRYTGLMTAEMVFLGTDGTERWQGKEFRDFARPHFVEGKGWTYIPSDRHIAVSEDGSMAWFDEALENSGLGRCRGSGVVLRENGEWKVAQYNLSIPVPNAMATELAGKIAELGG